MAVETYTLYQGDTGPIIRPRPSVLDTGVVLDVNWTCFIGVNDADGTAVVAKRAVTDKTSDNLYFVAALTPTETTALTVSAGELYEHYNMVVEVVNTTLIPPFNIEQHYTLHVKEQGLV